MAGRVADVHLNFGDVLDVPDITLMGAFQARCGPWVLRTDLLYPSLSDEVPSPAGTVEVPQEEVVLHPEVSHAVLGRPWGGVDAMVGARYSNVNLDFTKPPLSGSQDWADGTVGLGWRYHTGRRGNLCVKADLGTGGSDFTWEALGGTGYALGTCGILTAAFRHLDVDHENDNGVVYDVNLDAPAVGMTLRP